mmetsp:Transcript_20290/g.40633  ORF Transcript_20290/g.40633 Transcript_20290/m.40633 type:complete len:358 (-) Transcript_20290:223-1296(-)
MRTLGPALVLALLVSCELAAGAPKAKVLYAVNCGGPLHHDSSLDITYNADTGFSGGVPSDAGKEFSPMARVRDDTVYQTERYILEGNLVYQIPLKGKGKRTLVCKFSEVYFSAPGQKVFAVMVGSEVVVPHVDIYDSVGKGVPHDEIVEIENKGKTLVVNGKEIPDGRPGWDASSSTVAVIFKKLHADNPKINAIVVYEGGKEGVPKMKPWDRHAEERAHARRVEKASQDPQEDETREQEHEVDTETVFDQSLLDDDIWGTGSEGSGILASGEGLLLLVAGLACAAVAGLLMCNWILSGEDAGKRYSAQEASGGAAKGGKSGGPRSSKDNPFDLDGNGGGGAELTRKGKEKEKKKGR